jgi:hypothetical protein
MQDQAYPNVESKKVSADGITFQKRPMIKPHPRAQRYSFHSNASEGGSRGYGEGSRSRQKSKSPTREGRRFYEDQQLP